MIFVHLKQDSALRSNRYGASYIHFYVGVKKCYHLLTRDINDTFFTSHWTQNLKLDPSTCALKCVRDYDTGFW